MAIIVNEKKVEAGDRVMLHTGGLFTGGHGGINRLFLERHGASKDQFHTVTSAEGDFAHLQLPDGHDLKIQQGDVEELVKGKSSRSS